MKKVNFLLASISTLILTSCSHFHDDPTLSVWSKGLWIAPWLTGLLSVLFFGLAYFSSKSNSTTQVGTGTPGVRVEDGTGNVPFYKTGYFIFSVVFFIATIVIIVVVNNGK